MARLGRMAAGARNILNKNQGCDFTECRMKLKKFLYGKKYQTHECLAESIEKKVKKFLSGKKDMGDISSRVDAGSADAKKNHGEGVLPLLSNVMVIEGAAEMGLKGVGKMVSVRDKSLKAGAAEIGSSMLGLDGIESMDNVKQIFSKVQNLEGEFRKMDHKIEEGFRRLEILIKNTCGGGGPRPPQSGSGGGSGSDEDSSSGGFDIEE